MTIEQNPAVDFGQDFAASFNETVQVRVFNWSKKYYLNEMGNVLDDGQIVFQYFHTIQKQLFFLVLT